MPRPPELSDRAVALKPSLTLEISAKAKALRDSGKDICSLSAGEPDFATPPFIVEAAQHALGSGFTRYGPAAGDPDLRAALAHKLSVENGIPTQPEQVLVTNGGKQAIYNLFQVLLNPGNEVLLPAPYWLSYPEMAALAGASTRIIPTKAEEGFRLDLDLLEQQITPRSRLLVINSPGNPTGQVMTGAELEALAALVARHPQLMVMSDEIYEYLLADGQQHFSFAAIAEEIRSRCFTVNGFAKGWAMTGWRLGYIGAPEWIAKACSKIQGQVTSAPCSIAQVAAGAAVSEDPSIADEMKAAFLSRRDLMIDGLSAIPGLKVNRPMGAFYLFPDVSSLFGKSNGDRTIATAEDFAMYLLEEAHVATVGGGAFGTPECIRLSYAASEAQLNDALARISKAVAALQ